MIWVFGDSFSSNTTSDSWVMQLPNVIVKGTNGSSEYRIWKTYQESKHLIKSTDSVIFCHTSSSRVFLRNDSNIESRKLDTHKKCDLLVNDTTSKGEFVDVLETIWDSDYLDDTFLLLVNELKTVPNSTHITFFQSDIIDSLYDTWQNNKGNINHMSVDGNKLVFEQISKNLKQIKRIVSFGASLALGTGVNNEDSYISIISKHLDSDCDNRAVGGASPMQILHDILNYQFKQGDYVVITWAPPERDYIYGKKENTMMGSWTQDKTLLTDWANTHSYYDLCTRAWLNIHQATMYLESKGINFINIAGYHPPYKKHKPSYIDVKLHDSMVDKYQLFTKNGTDKKHPGPTAHKLLAKRILKLMGHK